MIINWVVAAISAAISYDSYKEAKKAQKEAEDASKGVLLNKNSNIENIPVIYGERRVGGVRAFISTKDVPGGDENEYLYIALVLAEGEVHSITDIELDEIPASDGRFAGLVDYNVHLGDDNQTVDSLLQEAPDWTSNHRLRGVAYIALRLKYDQDAWQGIPDITAKVQGKKLFDFRNSTVGYSNNPALCLYDYLTNTRYGKGLPTNLIDTVSFTAAANDCDNYTVTPFSGASPLRIFQCNFVVDTGNTILDNVKEMLSGCRGFLPFYDGKYGLIIDDQKSSVATFTTENIIGGISIDAGQKKNTFNRYTVKFANEDINYQSDQATFPDAGSTTETDFLDENNNEFLQETKEIKTITNYYIAREFARILTRRSRNQLRVTFTADSSALNLLVGDVITVNHPTPDWGNKPFQIEELTLNADMTVNILAVEYDSTIYTYDTSAEQRTYPDTNLPNVFSVQPPSGITVTNSTAVSGDGTVMPSLTVTWTAPSDSFVQHYQFEYKRSAETLDYGEITDNHLENPSYGLITDSADVTVSYGLITDAVTTAQEEYTSVTVHGTQYVITGVVPGINYYIRVRSVNSLGVRSSYINTISVVEGDSTPPSIPSNLTATGGLREITLSWERPLDTDYDHVQIWENNTNNSAGATQIAISSGDTFIRSNLGYDITKYYWIKSVDHTGNVSDFSSSANATTLFVDSDAFSDEVYNLFAEAGAYGIEPVSTLPASGDFVGQIKFDTTNVALYRWTGTAWDDDIFSIEAGSVTAASFAADIDPVSVVSTLPNPVGYTGSNVVFLTTDKKLYRYDLSVPEFTALIPAQDIDGTLGSDNFSQGLRPAEIVNSLPTAAADKWQGKQVFLTTDNKLYRYDGNQWTASVATTDLSGTIERTQIASRAVDAARIAVDAIQGDVIAAGAITETKIDSGAVTTAKLDAGAVTTAKLDAGAVTANKIDAGAVTTAKLDAGAVTTAKLDASAVTAEKIDAGAVTANKLDAGAVTADKIDAGAVTAAKIAGGTITANEMASNSVVAGMISAGAINSSAIFSTGVIEGQHLAGSTIEGDKIAANTITGGLIAASGVITSAAQIDDLVVTGAKIANLAVSNGKIANATIQGAKIKDLAVDTIKIANNAVTIPVGITTTSASRTLYNSGNAVGSDTVTYNGTNYQLKKLNGSVVYKDIGTITINSGGAPVLLNLDTKVLWSIGSTTSGWRWRLHRSRAAYIRFELLRGSTLINSWIEKTYSGEQAFSGTMNGGRELYNNAAKYLDTLGLKMNHSYIDSSSITGNRVYKYRMQVLTTGDTSSISDLTSAVGQTSMSALAVKK